MSVGNRKGARVYLFLQGPHGPFFYQLGKMLRRAGATVWRVGFNAGDRVFWPDRKTFIAFQSPQDQWATRFEEIVAEKGVTDIILYGEARQIHGDALAVARRLGLRTHLLEEGYLRPYWITYERTGTNGNSATRHLDFMSGSNTRPLGDPPPAHWGDLRQHIFYGALYNGLVMCFGKAFPNYQPHRDIPIKSEFALYLRRLLTLPSTALQRRRATRRIKRAPYPYHVALLQLEHDASFRAHSPFNSMTEFIETVIDGFAKGAPQYHQLVFKAHPLEDGRAPLVDTLKAAAKRAGISDRVHYLPGGKLASLLDEATSAVTVNSTAGQQVLWRGKPLKIFGEAIYDREEFVSSQPLTSFFESPTPPDRGAYVAFRDHLLGTNQIPGGYYSFAGRRRLLRRLVDLIEAQSAPSQAKTASQEPQIRVVQ